MGKQSYPYCRGDRFNPHNLEESKYAFAITTLAGNRATDNFIAMPEATEKGYAKAYEVNSNAQLYKQAGNGIVVDVFASILSTMKGNV